MTSTHATIERNNNNVLICGECSMFPPGEQQKRVNYPHLQHMHRQHYVLKLPNYPWKDIFRVYCWDHVKLFCFISMNRCDNMFLNLHQEPFMVHLDRTISCSFRCFCPYFTVFRSHKSAANPALESPCSLHYCVCTRRCTTSWSPVI